MKITADRSSNTGAIPDPDDNFIQGEDAEALVDIILNDPDVTVGEADAEGNQPIFYNGDIIGMLNPILGIGFVDSDAYHELSGHLEIETTPEISDAIMSSRDVNAADEDTSEDSLEYQIKNALDADMCVDIVNQAFSDFDEFSDDAFTYAGGKDDSFFEALNDDTPRNVAYMFFDGKDLDDGGPANPNRDYFRFDKDGNVESTDDPGAVYMDTILDDIVDYIIDHRYDEDIEFPEKIDKLINKYSDDKER